MDIAEAFQIVYDLALQNALNPETCDKELVDEANRQHEAINMIHDLAVNEFGDD